MGPDHGNLVKSWGPRGTLTGWRRSGWAMALGPCKPPGSFRRAQDQPFGGPLGLLEGLLAAVLGLKMAQDRSSWPKIVPKHENFIKSEGFRGFRRALQAPRKRPEGPRQALWGLPGASVCLLEAIPWLKMAQDK